MNLFAIIVLGTMFLFAAACLAYLIRTALMTANRKIGTALNFADTYKPGDRVTVFALVRYGNCRFIMASVPNREGVFLIDIHQVSILENDGETRRSIPDKGTYLFVTDTRLGLGNPNPRLSLVHVNEEQFDQVSDNRLSDLTDLSLERDDSLLELALRN